MPRPAKGLRAPDILNKPPGRYGDGGGLFLLVKPNARYWVFRYTSPIVGKVRELGLGRADGRNAKGLSAAREEGRQLMDVVRSGQDPIVERDARLEKARAQAAGAASDGVTFSQAAERYIETHRRGWRSGKHLAQWLHAIRVHCKPLAELPVKDIDTDAVKRVILPLWNVHPETASRLRARIEAVLAYAAVNGWRSSSAENPARWRGHFDLMVPRRRKVSPVEHFAAMPYREIAAFIRSVRADQTIAARCLEFLVLCASRSAEARMATWSEIDLDAGIWVIPPVRIKAGREHRVPLSRQAIELLRDLKQTAGKSDGYIFPGAKGGGTSETALHLAFKRTGGEGFTIHGLRSSFRDWTAERTTFPREICEAALAHSVGSVEAAYRRSDLLERRRSLMEAWAQFLDGPADNVVPLSPSAHARARPLSA